MNQELQAFADAMEEARGTEEAPGSLDFDHARELADGYVTTHPDEFTEHVGKVQAAPDEDAAQKAIIKMVEVFRDAGMDESHYRADAFLMHRWHPNDVSGDFKPKVRNEVAENFQPSVRKH